NLVLARPAAGARQGASQQQRCSIVEVTVPMAPHPSRLVRFGSLLAALTLIGVACSDDEGDGGNGTGGSGTGGSGTGGTGGAAAGGSGAGAATGGSTASGGNGAAGAGASAAGGASGSGPSAGGTGGAAAAGGADPGASGSAGADSGGTGGVPTDGGIPEPADGGLSPYAGEGHGETGDCGQPETPTRVESRRDRGNGHVCSNRCETPADCSPAPSGAEAEVDCVQFTRASRCLLVCQRDGVPLGCPDGMECASPEGDGRIGYCLWF